jgi:hypothetical protein
MSTSTPLPSASSAAGGRLRSALGKTFQSLATYNFRLFFIGQLISNTGNQLTNVVLILFVLKLGHSGLAVGALAACPFGRWWCFRPGLDRWRTGRTSVERCS